MKKILLLSAAYLLTNLSFGQIDNEVNEAKNLRFGLKGSLSIDWLSPSNKKKFVSNGSGLGYSWGAQVEYRLSKTVSFVSGVGIQTSVGKIGFFEASSKDSVFYILNRDEEFQDFTAENLSDSLNSTFWLKNRRYKINYVNIPIAFKMKTKEIGYFKYYGTFGLNLGIKTKAIVEDEVEFGNSTPTNTDLDLNTGASFARTGLIFGGGAEYNLSGSTSLFFDLTYNYFFSNALNGDDKYLGVKDFTVTEPSGSRPVGFKEINQKAIPGSVALTVGILF